MKHDLKLKPQLQKRGTLRLRCHHKTKHRKIFLDQFTIGLQSYLLEKLEHIKAESLFSAKKQCFLVPRYGS